MKDILKENIPRHVAIIMDGNGRWAQRRNLNRIQGHRKGIEVTKDIIRFVSDVGIGYLTLYAFSKENWNRQPAEVHMLMKLLELHLKNEAEFMINNKIRFRVIGNTEKLPAGVRRIIDNIEDRTSMNSGMTLQLALSYSGREEIADASKKIAEDVIKGKLQLDDIDEDSFADRLYTAGMPDPDLLIRTSGEMRISNFLLWQLAYTEIYVTDALWPDFTRRDMMMALLDYQKRERRFGLTKKKELIRKASNTV